MYMYINIDHVPTSMPGIYPHLQHRSNNPKNIYKGRPRQSERNVNSKKATTAVWSRCVFFLWDVLVGRFFSFGWGGWVNHSILFVFFSWGEDVNGKQKILNDESDDIRPEGVMSHHELP